MSVSLAQLVAVSTNAYCPIILIKPPFTLKNIPVYMKNVSSRWLLHLTEEAGHFPGMERLLLFSTVFPHGGWSSGYLWEKTKKPISWPSTAWSFHNPVLMARPQMGNLVGRGLLLFSTIFKYSSWFWGKLSDGVGCISVSSCSFLSARFVIRVCILVSGLSSGSQEL